MLGNRPLCQLDDTPRGCRARTLAKGEVDEVHFGLDAVRKGPREAGARLHAVEPGVADLQGDHLRPRRHTVPLGLVLVAGGGDARNVRAMGGDVADDRNHGSFVIDVQAVVHLLELPHGGPLPLESEAGQRRAGRQVPVLPPTDRSPPGGTVVPGDDVQYGAHVVVLLLERGELCDAVLQVLALARKVPLWLGVGLVEDG
mmetsp:Transcript_61850/g.184237  ORF Transcript_61850/g.184237 Transcript_61850/m.184237 type:complete len:200 (-) Transcript_61850:478-1077(-)